MRPFTALGVLAVCHFAATVSLQILTFASGMSRFDSGQPAGPLERGASVILSILAFPLLPRMFGDDWPVPWYFEGVPGYIPFVLNSVLWAGAMLGCVWLYGRYRAQGMGRPG